MNLVNMLTRRDPLKRAFVTLEDGMTDILNEEFMLPPEPGSSLSDVVEHELPDDDPHLQAIDAGHEDQEPAAAEAPVDRITAHTKTRLASHAAFDEARVRMSQDLGRIGEALGNILATQTLGREFVDDSFADIHRSNDLEVANVALATDNRRLNERVEKLEKLRTRYDQLIDVLKRRETKLLLEAETQREHLGALKLDAVEARNTVSRHESLLSEMHAALAARTGEAEHFMRDAEVLREKNVGLTMDLDNAQKRQAESRRKYEELSAAHASDVARLAEITGRLTTEENETARLQKLSDSLEAKLIEASESAAQFSNELGERDKRYLSENQALRAEIQSANARLHAATADQREAGVEVSELRSRLSDVESEKLILEKRLSALGRELETERRLAVAHGGLAALPELSRERLHRPTDHARSDLPALLDTVSPLRQPEGPRPLVRTRTATESDDAGFSLANGKNAPELKAPPLARSA